MPEPKEMTTVFTVGLMRPTERARTLVLCEFCGGARFTSQDNLDTARAQGMKIACIECAMVRLPKDGRIAGLLHKGQLIKGCKD